MADVLQQAGFKGNALRLARAVMMAESRGNPNAHNTNAGTGDDSYGLFQINMLGNLGPARRKLYGLGQDSQLLDPLTNAKVAYQLSKGGTDWSPWSTFKSGAYRSYLGKGGKAPAGPQDGPSLAAVAAAGSGSPDRSRALQGLLSSLQTYTQGGGTQGWGFKALSTTVQQIHANRQAQQEAAQYGVAATPVQLSSGHVMTGVNPNSPTDQKAVKIAESYLGTPYVWGGAKPGGFDCSGLLQYTWGQLGVKIPRTTYDQFKEGKAVGPNQLQPGDAVFFKGSDSKGGLPGHVGMYIGGGKYIQAPKTGDVVKISTLAGRSDYMGARRYA